ncbi:transposase [Methanophagales archaeon]|nr:transposase [Methanophagales archaeon]
MKEVELQESRRAALDDYLEVLGILGKKINEVEGILREKAEVTEEAMWLMSIVGIGFHNALLALSEIGEIARFRKPKSFVSYAGLAQKVEQSGDYTRYGHINKHSNGFLRWALIQSTSAAVHSATPNRFQRIYNRLKARRGEKVAIVATARHMAESVYWVLTKRESYKE